MKKTIFKVSALILMVVLSLAGCKKDSRVDDGVADVYVKSVLLDGQPVFGLVHYVQGYSAITSVTVSMTDLTLDQLSSLDATNTVFYSEPSPLNGSYSATVPTKGTYSYGVKFTDGVEKVLTDQLEDSYLLPPTITSISKTGSIVTLRWDPLAGAQYFQFNILRGGVNVFSSQTFSMAANTNYIDVSTSYINSYSPGNYTFELNAFKLQTADQGKLQATSSASADIDL